MITIFDFLKSLLFSKQKIELNCDDESQFSLFMINRWTSFYSKDVANYVNQTTNFYGNVFNIKQDQYNFAYYIFPSFKFKKIEYVKKVKKTDEEKELPITPEFVSRREYENYVEFEKSLTK